MLTTRFVSNCTADQVDDLKIAALYFDVVEVVGSNLYQVKLDEPTQGPVRPGQTGIVTGVIDLISDEFREHASVLEDEGLLRYVDGDKLIEEQIAEGIQQATERIFYESIGLLWEESNITHDAEGNRYVDITFADPEVERVHEQFVAPIRLGGRFDTRFVARYYAVLLTALLGSVATGDECVTSSVVLNRFVKAFVESERLAIPRQQLKRDLGTSPSWAYEAIRVNLPDVSKLSFDDVLAVRHELNDELLSFRHEMADIHEGLLDRYEPLYIAANAQDFVERKITPALEDLNGKIRHARTGVLKKLFDELRNPMAYTPLIGTFFDKIPLHMATMASLGLIGISTAWDHVRNMDQIRNNGLYYLIDLRNKAGGDWRY